MAANALTVIASDPAGMVLNLKHVMSYLVSAPDIRVRMVANVRNISPMNEAVIPAITEEQILALLRGANPDVWCGPPLNFSPNQ